MDAAETAGGYLDMLGQYRTWQCTLAHWQSRQAVAQAVTSVERLFQTYLEAMRRRVARMPGVGGPVEMFEGLWAPAGGMSVEESPMRLRSPTFCVMMRRPGLERRACTCGQRIWRRAMSLRSRGCSVSDGCADPGGSGGGCRRAG